MRIIARLDINNEDVIKGINFEGLRKVGQPSILAHKYYDHGADEIIYMDCVASLYGRNSLEKLLTEAAKNIFIPIAVGGGIRTIDDASKLFSSGADKVAINSSAIENPRIFFDLVNRFGGQSIILSIEAKKIGKKKWAVFKNYGRDSTNIDVIDWIKKISSYGVGEILLTSIDYEGLENGLDLELYEEASKTTNIPIIASGGFGKLEHLKDLNNSANIDALAISSALHYNKCSIKDVKIFCEVNNIFVRSV